MKRVSLAILSLAGLVGVAAPARADDLPIDLGSGFRDGRPHDRTAGAGFDRPTFDRPTFDRPTNATTTSAPRYAPPRDGSSSPFPPPAGLESRDLRRNDPSLDERAGRGDREVGESREFRGNREFRDFRGFRDFRLVYLPGHLETRRETVCEPAIYEDRLVPVFETRRVPIYGEVTVPVFDERLIPTFEVVFDRSGRPHRVQVGVRTERVQVGTRLERVQVGVRPEQVQVGTRTERVLVRAESSRIVERQEWVPGRYVTANYDGHDRHHFDRR